HAGIDIAPNEALQWITRHPAWALGIEARVGTLEAGKDADVVIWDRDLFSVYANAEKVFIDGRLVHDRDQPKPRWSDFEVQP
ncbi:MAG: amidohydrolase family protein, partial [Myxococcota bacterium]